MKNLMIVTSLVILTSSCALETTQEPVCRAGMYRVDAIEYAGNCPDDAPDSSAAGSTNFLTGISVEECPEDGVVIDGTWCDRDNRWCIYSEFWFEGEELVGLIDYEWNFVPCLDRYNYRFVYSGPLQ